MEVISSSKMSVTTYKTKIHHNSDNHNPDL
jgi:hypothetical protein